VHIKQVVILKHVLMLLIHIQQMKNVDNLDKNVQQMVMDVLNGQSVVKHILKKHV
jgi:hypothetical protein